MRTLITVEFICNGRRVPSDKLVPNSGNWQKRVIPAPKEKGTKIIDEPELCRNVDLRGTSPETLLNILPTCNPTVGAGSLTVPYCLLGELHKTG